MNKTLLAKLDTISERVEEISALLSDPDVMSDQNKFRDLSQEYAVIQPISECYIKYQSTLDDIEEARSMLKEDDAEMKELAQMELTESKEKIAD